MSEAIITKTYLSYKELKTIDDYEEHYRRQRRQSTKRNAKKYPNRVKARLAISHEIESGRMQSAKTQTCQHCSEQATMYHHHHGYEPEHWLDVIPLCRKCDFLAHS